MLHNVSCPDWGWETKPEGRDYGTWNDRHVARQHVGLPVNGDRNTDAVHATRATSEGPISSQIVYTNAGATWIMVFRDGRELTSMPRSSLSGSTSTTI